MPALLLTHDNLRYAKTLLRQRLPAVRSAHLTEALAAAVEHRTKASLQASLASPASEWPHFTYINVSKFQERLKTLNYTEVSPDVIGQVVRAPGIPTKLWIEVRNGDLDARNSWFEECSRRDVPMVYIEKRRKYAKLTWDCYTVQSKSIDAQIRGDSGRNLSGIMFRAFQHLCKPDTGRAEFLGSSFAGWIDGLRLEAARLIADGYCSLLYGALERAVYRHDSTERGDYMD